MKVQLAGFAKMLVLMGGVAGVAWVLAGWRYGFDRLPSFLGFPSMERLVIAVVFVALVAYLATLVENRLKVKR